MHVEFMYPYALLFILNFFEGSIVTLGAGLSTQIVGIDIRAALAVLIVSDVVSDVFYYYVGRAGGRVFHSRYAKLIGVTPRRLAMVEKYYVSHGTATLVFAKLSDILAMPGVLIAGAVRMKLRVFFTISVVCSIIKGVILYFGGLLISQGVIGISTQLFVSVFYGLMLVIVGILICTYFYKKISEQKT